MKNSTPAPIHAVVFDVFGTLMEFQDKRAPYRKAVHALARMYGVKSWGDIKECLMGQPVELKDIPEVLGLKNGFPPDMLGALYHDLEIELASLCLFDDTLPALKALRTMGIKTALCSNLVQPYTPPAQALLGNMVDVEVWSHEVGAIKTNPAIYQHVITKLGVPAAHILMVGDTVDADYTGPRLAGMQARHLARKGTSPVAEHITSLLDILPLIQAR